MLNFAQGQTALMTRVYIELTNTLLCGKLWRQEYGDILVAFSRRKKRRELIQSDYIAHVAF